MTVMLNLERNTAMRITNIRTIRAAVARQHPDIAADLLVTWHTRPRLCTFPTGHRAYHGEVIARADGYKPYRFAFQQELDGSWELYGGRPFRNR